MRRYSRRKVGALAGAGVAVGALAAACGPEKVPQGQIWPQFKHVVVVMFENRSLDNVLGWLYETEPPPRGQRFEGVAGKNFSNPIPPFADQVGRGSVPVGKGYVMDIPNPDPGEAYPHINTQLFGTVLPETNRTLGSIEQQAPYNLPSPVPAVPPMNGFVTDYVSRYTRELGVAPTYDQYRTIMDCFPPDALPIFNTLAQQFTVFDHWHCAVPSETFTNRSFFHAASSSGFVINSPYKRWVKENNAETILNRIDDAKRDGLSWNVYFDRTDGISLTAAISFPRLRDRLHRFRHMAHFYADARDGRLPAYSFIEPRLFFNHNDAHPPFVELKGKEWPSSTLAAEILLNNIYNVIRTSKSKDGSNYLNTLLLVTFDEAGGTFDHVAPPAAVPPNAGAPPGDMDFTFNRAGVRVPTIAISAWTEAGTIINAPFEHTALIKTLSRQWELGNLTERDKAAPDLGVVFNRSTPRARESWPVLTPRPLDSTATNNLGAKLNDLQWGITNLVSTIFDESSGLERDTATVRDALGYMRSRARRLGL